MKSIWDCSFIVTDVETTGSDPVYDRITEIACCVVHGGEIIAEYSSLINPHKQIPPFVVNMTGITQEMVRRAPEASKVTAESKHLFDMKNAIFVAHNVRFDYSFVQNTFERENYDFELPQLCTLKLARKMLPKDIKKNVGALAKYYEVNIINRHRAFGDAEATAYILMELLDKAYNEYNIRTISELLEFQNKQISSPKISVEKFSSLLPYLESSPEGSGVYYLHNADGDIIYIGMARSIKDKLYSYFASDAVYSKKISTMLGNVSEIKWTETNSELSAIILEANQIKKYNPIYNQSLKKFRSFPFIKINFEKEPYIEKTYSISNEGMYFGPFSNRFIVDDMMELIYQNFKSIPSILNESTINQANLSKELSLIIKFLNGTDNTLLNRILKEHKDSVKLGDLDMANKQMQLINEIRNLYDTNIQKTFNQNNVIIVKPLSSKEKLLEIIFIKYGIMKYHVTHGRRADTEYLNEIINQTYFLDNDTRINDDTLDELRIINSWMYKHKNLGKFIYVNSLPQESVFSELNNAIENFVFDNLNYLL